MFINENEFSDFKNKFLLYNSFLISDGHAGINWNFFGNIPSHYSAVSRGSGPCNLLNICDVETWVNINKLSAICMLNLSAFRLTGLVVATLLHTAVCMINELIDIDLRKEQRIWHA